MPPQRAPGAPALPAALTQPPAEQAVPQQQTSPTAAAATAPQQPALSPNAVANAHAAMRFLAMTFPQTQALPGVGSHITAPRSAAQDDAADAADTPVFGGTDVFSMPETPPRSPRPSVGRISSDGVTEPQSTQPGPHTVNGLTAGLQQPAETLAGCGLGLWPGAVVSIGHNTTLVTCPRCRGDKPFCVLFHGQRVDPVSGRVVRLTYKHLPNDSSSMGEDEARANVAALASLQEHFATAHQHCKYEVSMHAENRQTDASVAQTTSAWVMM